MIANFPVILKTKHELRAFVQTARSHHQDIALIPTMGALHEGHLSLVKQGLKQADCVIVSIFVNPAQFAPHEDLTTYPRPWEQDLEKLTAIGVHGIFNPDAREIYPQNFTTTISVGGVSERLEGAHRPGHFDGVATIVAKLLLLSLPDIALFGEKDWQQLQVIRRMVSDLDIPVEIKSVPIIRDEHGLALSSRNIYLSRQDYAVACQLNKILYSMAEKIAQGGDIDAIQYQAQQTLKNAGFDHIDYLETCDEKTLQPSKNGTLRIFAAVKIGTTRLIDNVPVL